VIAALVNWSRNLRCHLRRPHSRLRAHRNDQHFSRQHGVRNGQRCSSVGNYFVTKFAAP